MLLNPCDMLIRYLLLFVAVLPFTGVQALAEVSEGPSVRRISGEELYRDVNEQHAVMHYDYAAERFYKVLTTVGVKTVIELEPDEQIVQPVFLRHPEQWMIEVQTVDTGDQQRQQVLVTPEENGLRNLMEIVTDQRSYVIDLNSYPNAYMSTVKWNYLGESAAQGYAGAGGSSN